MRRDPPERQAVQNVEVEAEEGPRLGVGVFQGQPGRPVIEGQARREFQGAGQGGDTAMARHGL